MQEHDKNGRFKSGTKIDPSEHPRWKGGLPNCTECSRPLSSRILTTNRCRRCLLKFARGENANNWRGGTKKNSQGYRLVQKPNHPKTDQQGYVREHRLVMEKHLNRYLLPHEVIHHINHDKLDNRIENLQLMTKLEHDKHHMSKTKRDRLGRIRG